MSFRHTRVWTIKASPADVFRALMDPGELTQWFAEGAQVEPHVGGVYRFWGRHTVGTPPQDAARQVITRLKQDALLAFDWPINDVDTDVTVMLERAPEGTTLSITHRISGDLALPRQKEQIDDHWRHAIGNLIAHVEGGVVVMPDYFDPNRKVAGGWRSRGDDRQQDA